MTAYKFLHDEKNHVWILFRVEAGKHTAVLSSPKRKVVVRAYKRVKGFSK